MMLFIESKINIAIKRSISKYQINNGKKVPSWMNYSKLKIIKKKHYVYKRLLITKKGKRIRKGTKDE